MHDQFIINIQAECSAAMFCNDLFRGIMYHFKKGPPHRPELWNYYSYWADATRIKATSRPYVGNDQQTRYKQIDLSIIWKNIHRYQGYPHWSLMDSPHKCSAMRKTYTYRDVFVTDRLDTVA